MQISYLDSLRGGVLKETAQALSDSSYLNFVQLVVQILESAIGLAASDLGRVPSASKIENSCPKSGPDRGDTLSLNSLASSFYGIISPR